MGKVYHQGEMAGNVVDEYMVLTFPAVSHTIRGVIQPSAETARRLSHRAGATPQTPATPIQRPRINNEITSPQLRVIDAAGKNLGVISRAEALRLAAPGSGFDLIEIVSTANPPVARVMSFDKYRYERVKAEKKERLAQKVGGVKRVQITVRAAENDLMVKMRKLEEFLSEGHQVEVFLRLRGREKGNKAWAEEKLREFLGKIPVEYKVISPAKFGGQGYLTQITKK